MILLVDKRQFVHKLIEFLSYNFLKENISFIELDDYKSLYEQTTDRVKQLGKQLYNMPDGVPNLCFFRVDAAHSEAKRSLNNLTAAKEYYDTCHKYIF